jgi:hypothetical protein
MLRILFFCSVFSSLVICQQDSVKQITNLPFDCRNAVFFANAYNMLPNSEGADIVFEGYTGSESRIYTLTYSPEADTFINYQYKQESRSILYIQRDIA